jgi:UDP-N-acetylmuramate--alanine ligase
VLVLDDYAHHPTEISATLRAIKASWLQHQGEKYGVSEPGRLIAIFQPHRFSRTRELFSEFVTCFGAADRVIIGDIYAAGEEALGGVHSASLAQSIQHEDVSYCAELELCFPELLSVVKPGDIVIGLGAGSISQMIRKFGRELEESRG